MHKIHRERLYRLIVVILLFVLFTVVLATLFLMPSLLLSRSKEQEVSSQVAFLQSYIASQEESDVGQEVRDVRQRLTFLQPIVGERSVESVLGELVETQDTTIRLTSIRYVLGGGGELEQLGSIDIQGVALDRSALVSFANRLERKSIFASVDLPVSELATRNNIPFSLKFLVVKDKT